MDSWYLYEKPLTRFSHMKKILPLLLCHIFLISGCDKSLIQSQQDHQEPVTNLSDLPNPLVGTFSSFLLSNGNTYPAIALPWGMNFWTPQTGRMGDGWGYTFRCRVRPCLILLSFGVST